VVLVDDGEVEDTTGVEAFEMVDMPAVVVDADVEDITGAVMAD